MEILKEFFIFVVDINKGNIMAKKMTKFDMLNFLLKEGSGIREQAVINLYVIDMVSRKMAYKVIAEEYNKYINEGKDINECVNNLNDIVQNNINIRSEIRQLFNRFIKQNISLA